MFQGWNNLTLPTFIIGIGIIISTGYILSFFFYQKKKVIRTLVDPNEKVSLPLLEKEEISHDTRRYRFKLPSDKHVLGLPIGQHLFLTAKINDELVSRAYTPVTSDENFGYMDLVIKVYFKDKHPKFSAGGKMSQYVDNLKIGESISVRGPSGKLVYDGQGVFYILVNRKEPPQRVCVKKLAMIAGGTGITPMLQLIRHISKDPNDDTKMSLIFANQTEEDILLRNELEEVLLVNPEQFKLWYTVDKSTESWRYSTGFINADMIQEHLYGPSDDTLVLMCGPPPMVNFACIPNLDKVGYSHKLRFAY